LGGGCVFRQGNQGFRVSFGGRGEAIAPDGGGEANRYPTKSPMPRTRRLLKTSKHRCVWKKGTIFNKTRPGERDLVFGGGGGGGGGGGWGVGGGEVGGGGGFFLFSRRHGRRKITSRLCLDPKKGECVSSAVSAGGVGVGG